MTFTRKNHGDSHSYYSDGVKIPGVTNIIGILDKPALTQWAATTVATYAIENWARLSGMSEIARYEELKTAHRKKNKEAVVRGKRIHAIAERLIKGEEVAPDDLSLRAAARAYVDLLDAWELEAVTTEMPVVNLSYQYAGTADGIFHSPRFGNLIVDVKTGKRAYSEVALQLAAYRFAELYLEEIPQTGPRGGKRPSLWVERPMPQVDGAAVIWIEQETEESPAAAHLLPVTADETIWRQFLYLREVMDGWVERVDYDNRKSPTYAPPIGAELHPEMPDHEIRAALGIDYEEAKS